MRRDVATRVCLVLASVLLASLLCEAALRVLFPKYRDAAEGRLQPDEMRIYAPVPNSRDWRVHPDTGRSFPFHHNNLGLRQHRNFTAADLATATTVGVFGDSFVHSSTLDAPHVFTEPLDYLLNLDGDFAVLNFGVSGYGPAQSYFAYRSFPGREDLDYVLFVYFANNDVRDLVQNRLFDLDDRGRLRQRAKRGSAWWVPIASRLHLTYLALDAGGRLAPYVAGISEDMHADRDTWLFRDLKLSDQLFDYGLDVFGQLIRRWRREVEESGGRFFVVFLPTLPDFPRVRRLMKEAGAGVVDLNACYARRDEGHRRRNWDESPYRFDNDSHWNELGNRLAASCLDERLRLEAGLPAMTEAARDAALAEYYAAFESPQLGSAGNGAGAALPHMDEASRFEARRRIRRKYQALGDFDTAEIAGTDPPPSVHSDHYDVYFDGAQLLFAKESCHADDTGAHLLVQATPVDASDLPPNLSFFGLPPIHHLRKERRCIARYYLPRRIPLSHIYVGQGHVDQGDGLKKTLWSGEIVLDRAAFEKTLTVMLAAAGEPVIESGMDVHVHGQRIFYVSDDCEGTDGRTPFFLHVVPMREADLPPERIRHGYDNLDFHQAGVAFGERCVVRWHLPDYPVRRIRTGQYVHVRDGEELRLRNVWEGEAEIDG